MIIVSLALLLALAAGYLFWSRSKSEAAAQKKPADAGLPHERFLFPRDPGDVVS